MDLSKLRLGLVGVACAMVVGMGTSTAWRTDSSCHRQFRSEASDCNLGFRWALHSCSESSAVEPGEGQMGNVG